MNAVAHDFAVDLSPDESEEDTPELSVREEAVLVVAIPVAILLLIAESVLQLGYHALILLWFLFVVPLVRAARWLTGRRPHVGAAGKEEVALTYDELALIFKSLQAAKTLGALPPQDELLEDTIQVIDGSLNALAR
jgi:hypothetical protein